MRECGFCTQTWGQHTSWSRKSKPAMLMMRTAGQRSFSDRALYKGANRTVCTLALFLLSRDVRFREFTVNNNSLLCGVYQTNIR